MINLIPIKDIQEMQLMLNKYEELNDMAYALQKKVDTYTVENTNYDLLDHKMDCKILAYLYKRMDKLDLFTNFKRIIDQSKSNQVSDAELKKTAAINGTEPCVV